MKEVVRCRRTREILENQVNVKNKEPGAYICPTSYKESFEDDDLQIFIATGWAPVQDIQEISEKHLTACIDRRCVKSENS